MSDNDNQKDPWGHNNNQEPPDLDKIMHDFMQKLRRMFGGKQRQIDALEGNNPPSSPSDKNITLIATVIIAAIMAFWVIAGFYIVGPAKQAVVLRFGKYARTENPGLHWIPRFVESKKIVNIQEVTAYIYTADMLTRDENIVNVTLVVHYRVDNPKDFLFNVINARESLQQATASALRQIIGNSDLDSVLTTGRADIRQKVYVLLKQILALYKPGISVTDVVMQPAKPPEEVTEAFNDAIKAREDEQRYVKKAEAYQNKVVPIAQGQAKRLLQEAQADKQQVVLNAQGDVASFLAVLSVYKTAPKVTRSRMYLGTVESMLQKSNKVLMDTKGNNNLLYLPLDKWFSAKQETNSPDVEDNSPNIKPTQQQTQTISYGPDRNAYNGREAQQ